ncbi:MAG: S-layer homology domain-containing protein, partial [Oscillospiraceae bacterium]|nr:S-layer homology domain-containing protein [Oscillospiraceae bacterium]
SLVEWSARAAEGSASIDTNGVLSAGAGSMGVIVGRFYVSPSLASESGLDAAMTASATFGAESNSITNDDRWKGAVTPKTGGTTVIPNGINAKAGELVSMSLPQDVDENICAPYCYIGGTKTYVKLSAAIDGKLIFVAPYDATYYIEENKVEFSDISRHWAERYIDFSAARELLKGMSATEFDPYGGMTRAMFVTILGRMSNINEKDYATSKFSDVKAGSWYAPYVTWAEENGIVFGYDANTFGPDNLVTREQMCALLKRYLDFAGYSLALSDDYTAFTDRDSISNWAAEAVLYCQRVGLVQGKGNGIFDPKANLTRAEASTILERLVAGILEELVKQQAAKE